MRWPLLQRAVLGVWVPVFVLAAAPDFSTHWNDGKAEVNGYTYTQNYGGQTRDGKAALIFFTDEHSAREKTKASADTAERFPVFTVISVRDFQTGLFPQHLQRIVHARLDEALQPSRIEASAQNWTSVSYQQLVREGRKAVESFHYASGSEADKTQVHRLPDGVLFEDVLPLWVRELQGEWLAPGQTREFPSVPLLPGNTGIAMGTTLVTKTKDPERLLTVLGPVKAFRWTIETARAGTWVYFVERAWPHRILRWSNDRGEAGILTGSRRLAYGELTQEKDVRLVRDLGWPIPIR